MGMTQIALPDSWVDAQPSRPIRSNRRGTMIPVAFGGCFGWFHPAAIPGSLPVLLCPPLGREARWAHRSLRKLANRLAASGLSTLRFDYPNTGDSCDVPAGQGMVEAWRDSVHVAADWLRAQTGATELAMVGLRFGALLAADAAADRSDVAALALLAPVVSGRAYARELKTLARLSQLNGAADGVEMDGLLLDAPMLQAISARTLPGLAGPDSPVLLLEHGTAAGGYAATLASLGTQVTTIPFAGYADMMRSAVVNTVPADDIENIARWFETVTLQGNRPEQETGTLQPLASMALRPEGCLEIPLSFGGNNRLFGMLCRPEGDTIPETVVIIGNSGGDPHTGISRFGVTFARRLAAQGIASLRMDFAGLGDSTLGQEDRESHLFATDRRADFSAAVDMLAQFGFSRFAVFGLCTGAYHALAAAVADRRIDALCMVNLPTFRWRTNDPVDLSMGSQLRASASYRAGLRDWDNWARILRGDVAIGTILQVLSHRALRRAALHAVYAAERLGIAGKAAPHRPRAIMRALSDRQVDVLALLSGNDAAIDTLEAHFGQRGHRLVDLPGATVIIHDGFDHTLSQQRMRDAAIDIAVQFFNQGASIR